MRSTTMLHARLRSCSCEWTRNSPALFEMPRDAWAQFGRLFRSYSLKARWVIAIALSMLASVLSTDALAGNGAAFVSQSVPTTMVPGQTYPVSVTMQNTGDTTWSVGVYRLGAQSPQDNSTWGTARVDLQAPVAPGASTTFNFSVTAPSAVGTYQFQWRLVQEGVEWFGDYSSLVAVKDGDNQAVFVSQTVPATMTPGQAYPVSVTVQNTGTTTWTIANHYRLGAQNPQDNTIWGLARVELPNDVAPGDTVTFNFTVTAPSTPGTYNFQWQMLQEFVEWFGGQTPNVVVADGASGGNETNDAVLEDQGVPAVMLPGQSYSVYVVMLNTGTSTWTAGSQYRLGAQNPQDNTVWSLSRVELPFDVPPGSDVEFDFDVTAPSTPGTYNFQWRMIQGDVEWFGESTDNIAVQVGFINSATLLSQHVPVDMAPGALYYPTLVFRNSGTTTWLAGGAYYLRFENPQDNTTWGLSRVYLPNDVAPGDSVEFDPVLTAPTAPGNYNLQWRMSQGNVDFGDPTNNVVVEVGLLDSARFVWQQGIPASVTGGTAFFPDVTMFNNGTTTWTAGTYYLRAENPQDNSVWGYSRIDLTDDAPPGSRIDFSTIAVAPTMPGNYNFQWRMSKGNVEFGDYTDTLVVQDGGGAAGLDNAAFVSQSVPAQMVAGATYPVSVTMQNTGTTTWTAVTYKLRSEGPQDNTTWGPSRVNLPSGALPGSSVEIDFNVVAPSTAGTYNFQWRMSNGNVEFGDYSNIVVVQDGGGASGVDNAVFVSQNVPAQMVAGTAYPVSVTMQNTGTTTWTIGAYQLRSEGPQDNTIWGPNRINLPSDVPPGSSVEIDFNVVAPSVGGTYTFRWRISNGNVEFGDYSDIVVVQDGSSASGVDNAVFVSQNVPAQMVVGTTYPVSVTMQNTGTTFWAAGTYQLRSESPEDNTTWGLNRVSLPSDVLPGGSVEIDFNVVAPSVPGTYNFQWRMSNGNVEFGDYTNVVVVQDSDGTGIDNAVFVSQNVPAQMVAGVAYGVSVTMRNTGTTTWTSANQYLLGSQNPQNNNTWGAASIRLPSDVPPGATVTFYFSVTAPTNPGVYDFQWQMEKQLAGWFGPTTSDVSVSVQTAAPNPGNLTISLSGINDGDTVFEGTGANLVAFAQEANPDVNVPIVQISIDGQIVASSTRGATRLSYDWIGIGIGMHAITATAVDENGEVATVTKAINSIIDPQDVPFRAVLDNFKAGLASGNKAVALTYMSQSAQSIYEPVFDVLMSQMPQIVAGWSPPRRITVTTTSAEFAVTCDTPDGAVVYLISFVLDTNGNWVIDSMWEL